MFILLYKLRCVVDHFLNFFSGILSSASSTPQTPISFLFYFFRLFILQSLELESFTNCSPNWMTLFLSSPGTFWQQAAGSISLKYFVKIDWKIECSLCAGQLPQTGCTLSSIWSGIRLAAFWLLWPASAAQTAVQRTVQRTAQQSTNNQFLDVEVSKLTR